MPELEAALFTRLSGFAGLTALVATRVYPLIAPQNPTAPWVTYQRVAGSQRVSAMGTDPGLAQALIQLDAWATSYLSAKAVAKQVRLALERWRGTFAGVEVLDSFIERDDDIFEDLQPPSASLYRVSQDWRIWAREDMA